MSSYIEAAVLGRLGSSQMRRRTHAGKPFLTLSLAVQGEPTEWVNVAVFEPLLHELPDELLTGERCYAEGKVKLNRWKNKHGEACANLQLTASKFLALDRIGRRRKRRSRRKAAEDALSPNGHALKEQPTDNPMDSDTPF